MNITRITFLLVQITPIVLVVYVYHSDEILSLDMHKIFMANKHFRWKLQWIENRKEENYIFLEWKQYFFLILL